MSEGIVYLLTNPAMPGLVKIGMTSRDTPTLRMDELYTTGVPVPFQCVFAGRVKNADEAERALHVAFGPHRINSQREFFEIAPEQALVILKLLTSEDVTPSVRKQEQKVDVESRQASERLEKARRPRFNFVEMGVPIGAQLKSTISSEVVDVIDERRVRFRGEESSLSAATKELLGLDYYVAPTSYWTYEGRSLNDLYEQTYSSDR